jgi:hypothetical protein
MIMPQPAAGKHVLDGVEDRREKKVAHARHQRQHDVGRARLEVTAEAFGVYPVAASAIPSPAFLRPPGRRRERLADGRRDAGAAATSRMVAAPPGAGPGVGFLLICGEEIE